MRVSKQSRILLVDIETSPILFYGWRLWKSRALEVLEYSKIICWSVKWLGGKQTTLSLEDVEYDEYELVRRLWDMLNEADILIAHNGKAFDFGRMNSQFSKHKLLPPQPTQKIDTKRIAKSVFGFDSNSLEHLCQFLGIGHKLENGGYDLWKRCRERDSKAWRLMKKYNAHDVKLLEEVYLRLRPWIPDHPNLNLHADRGSCPKCGSSKLQSRGTYKSATRAYRKFQCTACGGWAKETTSIDRSDITNTNV